MHITYHSPINVCDSVVLRRSNELWDSPSDQLWNVSCPHTVSRASLVLCLYRLWHFM